MEAVLAPTAVGVANGGSPAWALPQPSKASGVSSDFRWAQTTGLLFPGGSPRFKCSAVVEFRTPRRRSSADIGGLRSTNHYEVDNCGISAELFGAKQIRSRTATFHGMWEKSIG